MTTEPPQIAGVVDVSIPNEVKCLHCTERARWQIDDPYTNEFHYTCTTHLTRVIVGVDLMVTWGDAVSVRRLW